MYSNLPRFIMILTSLSPVLLVYWVVNMVQKFKELRFYIDLSWVQAADFLRLHMFLLLFIVMVAISKFALHHALNYLTVKAISLKSFKPAETNASTIIFSWLLPWFKLTGSSDQDWLYLIGFFLMAVVYAYVFKNSNHYNLVFRLFSGYHFYEVTSTAEATYLLLSKKVLSNKDQVGGCIKLTDFMLINKS
jgi:hypothetical protein